MSPIRNYTNADGHFLGEKLAKWCDDAEPNARLIAPDILPRCASCAFRKGDHLASGSPATQMDALKCVTEKVPFYCHDVHRDGALCSGWAMMALAYKDGPTMEMPWEFIGGATP